MARTSRWDSLALGLLATLVAGFRYWRPSLWTDETATISAATRPLRDLWHLVHHVDAVHALYYLGMHFWIDVFGQSTWSVRFPSVVAIGFATAATVRLGQLLVSRPVGLLAGLIFLLLPRVTWAGTEARSSAIAAALAAWSFVALIGALRRGGRARWTRYGVLLFLGSATFLYAALIAVGQLLLAVTTSGRRDPRRLIPLVATMAVVALALLPLAAVAHDQAGQLVGGKPTLPALVQAVSVQQWFLGELPTRSQSLVIPKAFTFDWVRAAIAAAILTWVVITMAAVSHLRRAGSDQRRVLIDQYRVVAMVTVPWLVIPTIVILAYSVVVYPIYNARYFTFGAPALALLLAVSLRLLFRSSAVTVTAVIVLALVTGPVYVSQRGPNAKKASDWASAAAHLQEFGQPGEPVIYTRLLHKRGLTTGKLATAYPKQVAGLVDVTADRSATQANEVWGRRKPLAAVVGKIGDAPRVLVVTDRQLPYTATTSVERPILSNLGFQVFRKWEGPSTIVYELQRRLPEARPLQGRPR